MSVADLFSASGGIGAATKAYNAQVNQIPKQIGTLTAAEQQAIATQQGNQTLAINALMQGIKPQQDLYNQFSGSAPLFQGALGAGTPEQNATARGTFQSSPYYDYTLGQGLEGLSRIAQSTGQLGAGNMDAMKFAQNLSDQDYQNWLGNLFKGVGVQQGAANQMTGAYGNMAPVYANVADKIGSYQMGLGQDVAGLQGQKGKLGAQRQADIFGAKQGADTNTLNALFGIANLGVNAFTGGLGSGFGNMFGPSTGTGAFDSMMQGSGFMDNAGNIY